MAVLDYVWSLVPGDRSGALSTCVIPNKRTNEGLFKLVLVATYMHAALYVVFMGGVSYNLKDEF